MMRWVRHHRRSWIRLGMGRNHRGLVTCHVMRMHVARSIEVGRIAVYRMGHLLAMEVLLVVSWVMVRVISLLMVTSKVRHMCPAILSLVAHGVNSCIDLVRLLRLT